MADKPYSIKELKLTAAIYACMPYIVEHVRKTGRLPDKINNSYFWIPMNHIIRERGTDLTLTEKEKLVYDAILKEKRLPGGAARLVDDDP